MQKPRYALVAYLKNPAGEFVENLRRELHPDLPHLAAHLSILPPRCLQDTESAALQVLERICGAEEPFEVALGDVETFIPVTPTVYIRVEAGAARMIDTSQQAEYRSAGLQGRVAIHPTSHHREDDRRTPRPDGLSVGPRALGPLRGRPSYLGGKTDVCPRRCLESLGRSGARPSRPHSGFPVIGRNLAFSYSPLLLPSRAYGPRYITLPCVEMPLPWL